MPEKYYNLWELVKKIEDEIWAPAATSDRANIKYITKIGDKKVLEKAATHYVDHIKNKFGIAPLENNVAKYRSKLRMAGFGSKEGAEELNRRRVEGIKEADRNDLWAKDWIAGMFGLTPEEAEKVPTKVPKE